MDAAWIVSANAGRARVFAQENLNSPPQEINDLANPTIRMRTSESGLDPRSPTAATKSIHNVGGATPNKTYQAKETPEQHEEVLFARDVAAMLLKAYQEKRFRELTLVAGPQFLGVLRQAIDPQLSSAIKTEIDKDYTQYSGAQLLDKIQTHQEKG